MGRPIAAMPRAGVAAALLVAAFGAGVLGIAITDRNQATASWWPAAGVGVLALMLLPRRWWPGMLFGLAAAYVAANWVQDRTIEASLCLGLADVVETALIAYALHHRVGRRLRTVTDFGWLLGISLGAAAVAAIGIAITSVTLLDGEFGRTFAATAAAHWASVMLVAPLAMMPGRPHRGRMEWVGLQACLLLASTYLAFGPDQELTLGFLPVPFLIWAGVAFGYQVVAIEQAVLSVVVSSLTLMDKGPFAGTSETGNQIAQLYLVSLVIAGLPLALAVGEQREATKVARAQKARTEAVIESAGTPMLVAAPDGTLLAVNPATTALTGFAADELVGRPFWEVLLHPRRWDAALDIFSGTADLPAHGETILETAAGGERIVSYANGRLIDPIDGSVDYVITLTDLTAERASSHLLQHLLRSATTVAILGTDRGGSITLVNSGAEAMLRTTLEDATGRPFLDFLDPAEVTRRAVEYGDRDGAAATTLTGFAGLVAQVDAEDAPQTRDWTWIPPDGVPVRVSMTTSVVADASRRPIGYLFVAQDVTETRRNQELLHQALERERAAVGHLRTLDHAKDEFVSTVSHELRTPLTSIIGSTELLGDGLVGELDAEQQRLVAVIERNAERLLALANDLLLLAVFENNTSQTDFAPVDLREVIETSAGSMRPLLNHRDLEVRADVPDEPVAVLGDAGYLERALTNLLTNAVKFTPDGGVISCSLRAENGDARPTAVLTVADTGIGIPAEELAEVFQRFYRSSNVRADAIQGTGLGLSIVHSIVETHGGTIDVASEPGSGTIFTMTLPLA